MELHIHGISYKWISVSVCPQAIQSMCENGQAPGSGCTWVRERVWVSAIEICWSWPNRDQNRPSLPKTITYIAVQGSDLRRAPMPSGQIHSLRYHVQPPSQTVRRPTRIERPKKKRLFHITLNKFAYKSIYPFCLGFHCNLHYGDSFDQTVISFPAPIFPFHMYIDYSVGE